MSGVETIVGDPIVDKLIESSAWNGFIRVQPWGQIFPEDMEEHLVSIRKFEVLEDDVWITSFPKCGMTWTQQMVWSILNDFDCTKAEATMAELEERFPYFELTGICNKAMQEIMPNSFEHCKQIKARPRLFKSHLMYDMLPDQVFVKKPKIIHVTRNPRDACISLYNYSKVLKVYSGPFEDFVEAFLNDTMAYYAPFMQNVRSYWERREMTNILFITYEDMTVDLASVIDQVAKFVGKTPTTDDVSKLCDHLSFENMKGSHGGAVENMENITKIIQGEMKDMVMDMDGKGFMRTGKVGGWVSALDHTQVKRFEEWEKKGLKDSDLKFTYSI